jgi:hypothetical protein
MVALTCRLLLLLLPMTASYCPEQMSCDGVGDATSPCHPVASLSLSLSLTLELIKYLMKWRKYRSISLLQYNSVRVAPLSHRAAIRHPAPRSRCVCCVAIHHPAPCSYLAHHQSRMSLLSPLTHSGFTRSCPALGARTDGHISTRDASAPRFFLE